MNQLVAMLKMGRFTILPGGMLAYALGTAMGANHAGGFHWAPALLGFLVTELANLAAHYADEYADIDTDSLARRTLFSGGSGVLPSGAVPPSWALITALILAGLSLLFTALFTLYGWLPAAGFWILAAGLLLGWFYSMKPLSLERRTLGEPVNAVLGGFLMPLMGYTMQTGAPSWPAFVALAPVFLMVFAGLLGVHWADREADRLVGKRSMVVLLGKRTRQFHNLLTMLAYSSLLLLAGNFLPPPVVIAFLATLPFGLWAAFAITRQESPHPGSLTMAIVLIAATAGWILA
jgi:1,4-dihydroxy-2-naphthoate polyprenyltransferase